MVEWSQRRRRAVRALAGAVVAFALVTGCGGQEVVNSDVPCSDFTFDRQRWNDGGVTEREGIAEALIRCKTLAGKSNAQVNQVFGTTGKTHAFFVGSVHGGLGPSDSQLLEIRYDKTGHVNSVGLAVPPETVPPD